MKVLVVVDMQNDFIDGSLGNEETKAIAERIVAKIKKFKGIIIITKDTHFGNYMTIQEGKKLPVIHCQRETFGWEVSQLIMDAIIESGNEYFVIEKETFGSPNLSVAISEIVKDLSNVEEGEEIEEIEFVGTKTAICVVSNAILIKSYFSEIPVVVDAKCVACVTPESNIHALETMKMCQIDVINE